MTDTNLPTTQGSGEHVLLKKSKKRPQDSNGFFNLLDYAKARIMNDMLESKVLPNCRESPSYLIMVLDEVASKTISNFCTMFDLMEAGHVYQVEKLCRQDEETKEIRYVPRKRFPMSDVVYLVSPCETSIDFILQDFPEKDQWSYDHYGSVHLCFLSPVSQDLFQRLASSPKLANKLRTLVEVNLDFKVWQGNVFKVPTKIKQLPKLIS